MVISSIANLLNATFPTVMRRTLIAVADRDDNFTFSRHRLPVWPSAINRWRLGLVVGLDQRSYSTLGPVSSGMSDRLRAGKPPRFVTSHSDQLSLLPSAGRKMSTGQTAVTLCGWRVKAGMGPFHLWINVWVAGKTV